MPTAPNNKNYFEISGTPTVTEATTFEVKVTGSNGSEEWYYRSHVDGADWSTYNTAITLVVDTSIQLGSTGVYIKFTRPSATTYTPGDKWVFSTLADVKLDESVGQFDHIETIDVGDERNLIAISSSTGRVATIEKIDGDTPQAVPSELNIGAGTSGQLLDFEKKNKELYIAKGRNTHPQFLGYSKNNGFEGVGELELRSNPALDTLEGASNPMTDAYDMSVILRAGGGAELQNARIAVGINNVSTSGAVKNSVSVQHLTDNKLYEYGCATTPIAIKRWYGRRDSSGYCDGFAVLREPLEGDDYVGTIDLWDLNSDLGGTVGQQANMYSSIHLKRPEGNDEMTTFGDFYIVPETSAFLKWFIVGSKDRGRCNNFDAQSLQSWLFKSDDITTTQIEVANYTISESGWDDITPKLSQTDTSPSTKQGNEMYYMQECINAGGDVTVTAPGGTVYTADMPDFVMVHSSFYYSQNMKPRLTEVLPNGPISFAGFNGTSSGVGISPMISFTGKVGPMFDSFGTKYWHGAHSCFQTVAQKQINTGVDLLWDDALAHNEEGWVSEAIGPFMSNDAGNTAQINYRPVHWCTWMIQLGTANYGPSKYKVFPHMLDWAGQGSQASKWKAFKGNQSFNIPAWATAVENESGEGEQNKTAGTAVNKGIVKLAQPPSKRPAFGLWGRVLFSTIGTTRQRHLLHYIRPGNRRFLTFRFGTETGPPQSLSDKNNPMIFPNAWVQANGSINDVDYQALSAYSIWNQDDTASTMSTSYFGTSANATNHRRYRDIPATGAGGDDKLGYRPAEHGNIVRSEGGQPSGIQWYPQLEDKQHIFGVKFSSSETKQRFKAEFQGTNDFANLYTGASSEFSVETPTESGVAGSWSGPVVKKCFYKASLIYDGYQETPLLSTGNSFFNTDGIDEALNVEIRIKDTYPISERVTGCALYRATSQNVINVTDPESLYRFVEEIPLFHFNHNDVRGDQSFTVRDTGDAEGTYESINGVSEKIYDLGINYTVNTQQNGYHFISNCAHSQVADAENYLFRSQPGKFAIFDWTRDFVELPFIPSSIIGHAGKVFCFSTNQLAIVNPENLFIEDVIEGVGCINSKTSLVCDAGLVFADYRNIYLANPAIKPIGSTILNVPDDGWLNLSLAEKRDVRCGYDSKRKAFLFFYTRGTNYRCWAYSFQKRRWDLFETPDKVMDTTLTKDGATMLLLQSNKLAKFLSNTALSKDWSWESKRIQLGNTMVDKKIRNFKLESNSRTLTSMQYKLDGDSDWKTGTDVATSFTGSNNRAYKLQNNDTSKKVHWLKLKIAGDNADTGTDVKSYATSVIYKSKRPK